VIPSNIGPLRNKLSFLAAKSRSMNSLLSEVESALELVDNLTPEQKAELVNLVTTRAADVTTAYDEVVTVYTATEPVEPTE
jgi:hypothetical protein